MRWLLGLLLCFNLWPAWAAAVLPAIPALQGRVNDHTGSLDGATKLRLEKKLAALEQGKGAQLALLIVASTRPEPVEAYALKVAEAWKLGRRGVDDGALLLVAKDDRRLRIEVGYGLEGAIPDALAKRIIEEIIVPRFKAGDYAGGIEAGMSALIGLVEGEPLPTRQEEALDAWVWLVLLLGVLLVSVVLARQAFAQVLASLLLAAVAVLGIVWVQGKWQAALFLGLVIYIITLVFALLLTGKLGGARRAQSDGVWSSGAEVGGAVSSSGFFSGGGGGFGGGGASGSW